MSDILKKPLLGRILLVCKYLRRLCLYTFRYLYAMWSYTLLNGSYLFSPELRRAYRGTLNLLHNPDLYAIDSDLHENFAKKAVHNYKLQINTAIKDIYKPGENWATLLNDVYTVTKWKRENDDNILSTALYQFYRTDLILGHSGDFYITDIKKGDVDLKFYAYMVLERYKEFTKGRLKVDPKMITTTDIGQNIYVKHESQKLTFRTIRHVYYLNRLRNFNLLNRPDLIIGELGCGAAELAILTKKMLPDSKYVCFDLPQTLLVASYNIMMTFPQLKIGLFEDIRKLGGITREEIQKYDILMLPNWCMESVEEDSLDLFINIGSLSEMDLRIIENYLNLIENICRGHFYTVNRNVPVYGWGSYEIPLDKFPFSKNSEVIYKSYDVASDIFHARYRKSNLWELVLKYKK